MLVFLVAIAMLVVHIISALLPFNVRYTEFAHFVFIFYCMGGKSDVSNTRCIRIKPK